MYLNLAKAQRYRMYLGKCPHCGERLHLEQEVNLMKPRTLGEQTEEVQSLEGIVNE